MKTVPRTRTPEIEATAMAFALAHHRWLLLSTVPQSWTEPDRQRLLAAAFLDFHAAKLTLVETADSLGSTAVSI